MKQTIIKITIGLMALIGIASCGGEKNIPETNKKEISQQQHDTLEKLRIETNQRFETEIQKEIEAGRADSIQVRRLKLNIMLNNGEITLEQHKKADIKLQEEAAANES